MTEEVEHDKIFGPGRRAYGHHSFSFLVIGPGVQGDPSWSARPATLIRTSASIASPPAGSRSSIPTGTRNITISRTEPTPVEVTVPDSGAAEVYYHSRWSASARFKVLFNEAGDIVAQPIYGNLSRFLRRTDGRYYVDLDSIYGEDDRGSVVGLRQGPGQQPDHRPDGAVLRGDGLRAGCLDRRRVRVRPPFCSGSGFGPIPWPGASA